MEYFQFGAQELLYWDDDKDKEWFVPKKFENLKQEILENKFCTLSIEQWDGLYIDAQTISESNKATEYLSYDALGDNGNYEALIEKYGIYEYTPIKINHICSILLYSNYYQLQQILISTFRRNRNESKQDYILRQSQFANWTRYLHESCKVFGKMITDKDIFYYSINSDSIDFGKSLCVSYNVPISMTRDLFVAQSYFEFDDNAINNDDKVGMLLSISKQIDFNAYYIDCGWCSDFPAEQEVLVLSIYPNLARIQSMVHISYKNNEILYNNYQFYMSAISDLQRMCNGSKASDMINRDTKIALDEMIRYRFGEPDPVDNEEKQEMKEVRLTAAETSTATKPEFVINISAAKTNVANTTGSKTATPTTQNTKTTQDTKKKDEKKPKQEEAKPKEEAKSKEEAKPTKEEKVKPKEETKPKEEAKPNEENKPKIDTKPNDAKNDKSDKSDKSAITNNNNTAESKQEEASKTESKATKTTEETKNENDDGKNKPKQKVRPKGKLKGSSDESKDKYRPKEVVFKLKAKRRRKVPDYVKNMFDEYCLTVKEINIDFSRMVSLKHGYRAWKDIFMNDDDSWMKMDILVKLFPNVTDIKIHYVPQAFTKQTIKACIEFLNCDAVTGRELEIRIYRPQKFATTMFDDDNKGADVEDFTLQNALNKYLLKKSKVGNNFKWFCRFCDDGQIPCIEIIRPHKAIERNKDLSRILNEKQINMIMELITNELKKNKDISDTWYLNLLYRASRDGFDSSIFHKACNGIGHTFSVIKSTTNEHIFGAYTSKEWGRTGKWLMDKFAFLIPIQSKDPSSKPRIINIRQGHEQYGMYLQTNGGPGFGKGDIKILNKADKSSRNTCNSNSFTFNMKPNELVGGKGAYFKVADYEVFQIAFY